ncbi:DUF3810 domain-containing protein [Ferruginibacter lapsinanis]|uniref:DUF3810 domain-containing protein n=1 Tax=Ferruginibacter lapsinanis TaxID=563172 RepID=UPI001E4D1CC0|nr:DUF3810 domain-containing protein [Ferruginibacter lapsinanis]UEG49921.1 DUF3810 domain-containing protein [Ferruginibacter lapsinanis]
MISKKQWFSVLFLLMVAISIRFFSANPFWAEKYYAAGFYPVISRFLRMGFGWLPFSIGDLIYGIIVIWLFYKIVYGIKLLCKRSITFQSFKSGIVKWSTVLLFLYILFNLIWGINYDRKGIAYQLGLSVQKYTIKELQEMDSLLLQKVNESKKAILKKNIAQKTKREIFDGAVNAYTEVERKYLFLHYTAISVKPSMWGWVGDYLGFTGYYNPFTGEAQINRGVPVFLQPYTTCHEIAHQLGYAKEDEANFVGYLAASASKDTVFNYSTYLDLFMYANRSLAHVDSSAAKNFFHQLLPEVKTDIKEWKTFLIDHKNPIEPGIRWMYGKFLESNNQPSGMLSYDEVTGLLIAYYKKYGKV